MKTEAFFDKRTSTLTYVVHDPKTLDAAVIDPVLDYDSASSTYDFESLENVEEYIKAQNLNLHLIMETHAHADHLTGAQELKKRFPNAKVVIGKNITKVQDIFKKIYNLGDRFKTDGSQFDKLLEEGELIKAGTLEFKVLFTPGHTPACASYCIDDAVFTGDALFMPDYGVGRCDFPGGSAESLYKSVQEKLYTLPENTRTFTGHDYQPNGRAMKYESSIAEQKSENIHLKANTTEKEFVEFRTKRDSGLSAPKLLLPSIEVNVDAGHFPEAEDNGVSYLKIPLRKKK